MISSGWWQKHRIHIRFGLKSRVPSPEPWPVTGSRSCLHVTLVGLSGQGHGAHGNAKPPDLCRPSFGSGNGNSLGRLRLNGNSLGRLRMRIIKLVLLLGVVIAIAVWMLMYFSPYNSCIREGWSQEICERGLD